MLKFLVLLSIVAIIFAMPRGFDISDEGVYALLAVPSQENIAGVFNYDLFFKFFYKITGVEFGLIGLRILRLITCFVAAGSLSIFWSNLYQKKVGGLSVFFICLSGVLGSYGFLSQTLSYNSINLMCGCLWLGLISRPKFSNGSLLLLGTTLSLLFYSKITVCLILGLLTVGIIMWNTDRIIWGRMLLVLSLPFLLLEIVFFFMLGESGILRALAAEKMLEFRPDYHFMTIVKYSIVGIFWSVLVIIPFFLAGYLKRISSRYYNPALLIGLIIFTLVSYFTTITNEVNHVLFLSTLSLLGFLMGSSQLSKMTVREAGFLSLLIIFPFILHFGSNVYFLRLGIHYWVFWILAVLFILRFNKFEGKTIFQCLLPILSLILVFNGISLYSFNFYNYNEETAFWEYRKGKSIRIPLSEIDLYSNLIKLTSLSEESNVLPIFRNPGLVYMIGKSHPRTPGLWSRQQLEYFFPDSKNLSVILYNSTFEFPFEKKKWREGSSFKLSDDEYVKVFWKK
jgi:hypothetical protein